MSRLTMTAAILFTVGCAPPSPEEQQLRLFFEASRARDETLLAKLSSVSVNPATEGTVRDFELIAVGPEERAGDVVTKPVTVSARLHTPQSQTISRTLVFTFQRKIGSGQAATDGVRWTIVAFTGT